MSFKIVMTCPECGSDHFVDNGKGAFKCEKCGIIPYLDEMVETRSPDEFEVQFNGGKIIVSKTYDPEYPGACICYQTESGDLIDVVCVEAKPDENKKDIHVYCYEDVVTEDWTHKFIIRKKAVERVLGLE